MTFAKRFDIKKAMQATTESIVEDLVDNGEPASIDPTVTNDLETPTAKVEVSQEGDTVDMLEASTPTPVEEAPVVETPVVDTVVDAPVDGVVEQPVVVEAETALAETVVDAPVVVEPTVELAEPIATDGDVPPLNTEVVIDPVIVEPVVAENAEAADATVVVDEPSGVEDETISDSDLAEMYEEEIEVGTEAIALLEKLSTAIETSTEAKVAIETIEDFSKVALESICATIKMPTDSKAYPSLEAITVDSVKDFANKLNTSVESFKEKVTELKAPKE